MASNPIIEAAVFAKRAHEGQLRKYTNAPYITHPARVAARVVLLPSVTEAMVCAAWLHDVCEDCGVPLSEIELEFGGRVAEIVGHLTNTSKLDHPEANRAARKAIDIQRLRECDDDDVQNIKIIDRIDNLSEMHNAPADFYQVYLRESRMLLDNLLKARPELRAELHTAILMGMQFIRHEPAASEG